MDFRGKKVLIVGLGKSGQAAARFFLREGAEVALNDEGFPLNADPSLVSRFGQLEGHWGGHPVEIFSGRDLICLSPGVPGDLPGLQRARKEKIPVVGEFGLAAEKLKEAGIPLIAVTGTNGKSTTVTLITRMLEAEGAKVSLAGNIGRPLMDVVLEDKGLKWVVVEASSYQLETAIPFRPKISLLLNITEDHLDRYRSMRNYSETKFGIFKGQGVGDSLIYNQDDAVIRRGVRRADLSVQKVPFSMDGSPRESTTGLRPVDGEIIFRRRGEEEKYSLKDVNLPGVHNLQNMMASIAGARLAGASPGAVQEALRHFAGLPHRTEFVREHRQVRYYDDSKGTNVDAAVKSLAGLPDKKVILIAGGRDKGGNYKPLRLMAEEKLKVAILIGEAREKMAEALGATSSFEVVSVEKLNEAVLLASVRAAPGDVVLLSPACSSFDQFRDYKERGDKFQELVRQL